MCRYRGKGTKWFKGVISRDNRDGTYDLAYDDGDKDLGALATNIRSLYGGGGGDGGGALREGMKVEARFKGKTRYYPGVLKRENRDGTFDIDYDDVSPIYLCSLHSSSLVLEFDLYKNDAPSVFFYVVQGEREMFVEKDLIRALETGSSSPVRGSGGGSTSFREGDKIEGL